jgi:hypothetical protein
MDKFDPNAQRITPTPDRFDGGLVALGLCAFEFLAQTGNHLFERMLAQQDVIVGEQITQVARLQGVFFGMHLGVKPEPVDKDSSHFL